ncbi:YokU family protein [Bacillus sp. ISL-4]|uniref:YokU family protein n=1 Tax=Bacillus sp. ISL-4 TaxID=2819125 RepID=UPI001BEC4B0A|nr:YokU family protein [Bacillus sp. ISL-4]MBT2664371.1 YokU family protein [Bacillus sp. ISL-4]MBT2669224.1 YokU family protein [Streptomyces sp. ISL-14]
METCPWCEKVKLATVKGTVYWELPDDGTRAVEIRETPSSHWESCDAFFQSDEIVKEIENQLFLIDSKQLEKQTKNSKLMNMKRLLKHNYFDF